MLRDFAQSLLAVVLVLGCTTTAPEPLVLSEEPVTRDGLHRVIDERDFTLYMSPAFTEKARSGAFKGRGLYIRSCNVTFADSDQEALFSTLRDRMQGYLCETVKRQLDERGIGRVEAADVTPETRVVDLWLLHVSLELPDVSGTSATTFIFSGASEEMTFGWVGTEAGTGLPILRYYSRGRFSHTGHYLGDGKNPNWGDVKGEIDQLSERALDTLLAATLEVIGKDAVNRPVE